jgi:dipeptidyl aminopeptidase/acylaminoacyl peptidase
MKKSIIPTLCFLLAIAGTRAQENTGYRKPSAEILKLVDVPRAPSVQMDRELENMVLLYRDAYKTIEELSQQELRLGGLRIDPKANIGSRTSYYNNLKVRNLDDGDAQPRQVAGLPPAPKLSNISWSPDQTKMAFTHTVSAGVEVWVLDLPTATAKRLTEARVNANLGDAITWFKDGEALLVKMLPAKRAPLIDQKLAVPTGPTISVADGKKARNRTYQDLLQNKSDEHNFKLLATSEIHKVRLDGSSAIWLESAMYRGIDFSPDGAYALVTTITEPFSYLVPYSRFPSVTTVHTKDAAKVATVAEIPLIEVLPKGFMATRTGRRHMDWRSDQPATLVFAEALDGGDPENEVEFRDEVKQLEAPFSGEPATLLKTINRFAGITWGDDHTALCFDQWWNTRNEKTYLFDPAAPGSAPTILFDRNTEDKYGDPGQFVTRRTEQGERLLARRDNHLYLLGAGYTEEGQFPFLDELDLATGKCARLYQSAYTNRLESLIQFDADGNRLLTREEAPTEYPNYCFRNLADRTVTRITSFENPYESLRDVHKEVINYTRDDGLPLSATLYLPADCSKDAAKKAPMLLWAYPKEYKDLSSAGQITSNPNRFTYLYYGSPIFWVAKGYAVLDNAAFPIVGEGDEEPNDTFRTQLVANAKAAIDAVDALGYIDRSKVAVGGHSYGAFMVANLLTHSDLFAAGIARSGAYNRTLTPFGFQREERDYWEAPEVYNAMSPFMHADKMKTPLLLIHGEADNNSGTYPMQSERYFNALKGLGATVRLVLLPKESHGYQAKESILHLLYEQEQWLQKHLE